MPKAKENPRPNIAETHLGRIGIESLEGMRRFASCSFIAGIGIETNDNQSMQILFYGGILK